MTDAETAPDALPLKIESRIRLGPFVGLSFKIGLLNIITLTLYRFWGRTEVRRRVWGAIRINDEPLEYAGRGLDLFLGFLIAAFGIGLPLVLVVGLAQLAGPLVAPVIILPVYILLFFLIGFGIFTAFRYLASRTLWRGIRFSLPGSPRDYGLVYLAYGLLTVVTLGWYWPAASRQLSGRLWGALAFGDLKFRFDLEAARKVKVYPTYALAWVGFVVAYIGLLVAIFGLVSGLEAGGAPPTELMWSLALLFGGFIIVVPLLFAPYQAAALRSVAAGVRLGDVRFQLKLEWFDMVQLIVGNVLLITISFGFLMPLVQARTVRFMLTRLRPEGGIDLDHVVQTAGPGPKFAEGIADAFGFSMI